MPGPPPKLSGDFKREARGCVVLRLRGRRPGNKMGAARVLEGGRRGCWRRYPLASAPAGPSPKDHQPASFLAGGRRVLIAICGLFSGCLRAVVATTGTNAGRMPREDAAASRGAGRTAGVGRMGFDPNRAGGRRGPAQRLRVARGRYTRPWFPPTDRREVFSGSAPTSLQARRGGADDRPNRSPHGREEVIGTPEFMTF
jgi:hypothetical protein